MALNQGHNNDNGKNEKYITQVTLDIIGIILKQLQTLWCDIPVLIHMKYTYMIYMITFKIQQK